MKEDTHEESQGRLFSKDELAVCHEVPPEPRTATGSNPVWTDNKARFIMLYLRYFVYITHHGTYIDGFAGPQAECETESWAAKLVLESKPRWIRHLHLCDASREQAKRLQELKELQPLTDEQGRHLHREIHVYHGDFNEKIDEILKTGDVSEKEATFCLLDQRTFECDWHTVEKVARFKKSGNKIELFYFLANGWFERALSGQKDMDRLARWWGRDDWTDLKSMTREGRCDIMVHRLKSELLYQSAKAYPIYKKDTGGAIMYYMIHATDHPQGPVQMARAYRNTVRPVDPFEDTQLDLFAESDALDSNEMTADCRVE
jgi:three-Cys-motif partner protein